MTAIKDVTGTAFIVAEFRIQETVGAHPLYVDHVAPLFLTTRQGRRRAPFSRVPAGGEESETEDPLFR